MAQWKRGYEAGGKPGEVSLRKQLNAIKAEQYPWLSEVTKVAPQQAIKNLGTAFQNFFRRVKPGQKPGYPRFKKKGIRDNFRADNGPAQSGAEAVKVDGRRMKLPRCGWVRMREALRFSGQIKSSVISRAADGRYVALRVETEHRLCVKKDLGIKALATLSNGEVVVGPKPHRALGPRLRRLSRSLSRKQKGSANRQKAKAKLSRLHLRISNLHVRMRCISAPPGWQRSTR